MAVTHKTLIHEQQAALPSPGLHASVHHHVAIYIKNPLTCVHLLLQQQWVLWTNFQHEHICCVSYEHLQYILLGKETYLLILTLTAQF
jgi:hypothetical protein